MIHHPLAIALCLLAGALSIPANALAQPKPKPNQSPNQRDERRENQRVREAQQALQQAQARQKEVAKDLNEAKSRLGNAESEKRQAIVKAQHLREAVETNLQSRYGIDKLLAEQKEMQAAFDRVAEPILATLKQGQEYQAAVADAKVAAGELERIKLSNPSFQDDSRVSAIIRRTVKPGELEKTALEANKSAVAAKDQLSRTQEKIRAARMKMEGEVNKDANLRGALEDLERRNQAVEKAKAEVAKAADRLESAVAQIKQHQAQLARAVAADRSDPNKNNKKPNNKPKKK